MPTECTSNFKCYSIFNVKQKYVLSFCTGIDQSSYSSAVTPFPAHALATDSMDGAPSVGACVAEPDATKECLCHLEVHKNAFLKMFLWL